MTSVGHFHLKLVIDPSRNRHSTVTDGAQQVMPCFHLEQPPETQGSQIGVRRLRVGCRHLQPPDGLLENTLLQLLHRQLGLGDSSAPGGDRLGPGRILSLLEPPPHHPQRGDDRVLPARGEIREADASLLVQAVPELAEPERQQEQVDVRTFPILELEASRRHAGCCVAGEREPPERARVGSANPSRR